MISCQQSQHGCGEETQLEIIPLDSGIILHVMERKQMHQQGNEIYQGDKCCCQGVNVQTKFNGRKPTPSDENICLE